jgi:glyoxylase-like metal-dependent hydrolase (beta-lactamase superfamily II)
VLLFEPRARLLISAMRCGKTALAWCSPSSTEDAFAEVGATLDLIARLQPLTVIPGHGGVFADVPEAIARARRRLAGFEADP